MSPWSLYQREPHPDLWKRFIYSLIASFGACVLSAYHLPDIMLGAEKKVTEKGPISVLTEPCRRQFRSQAVTFKGQQISSWKTVLQEYLGAPPLREDLSGKTSWKKRHLV